MGPTTLGNSLRKALTCLPCDAVIPPVGMRPKQKYPPEGIMKIITAALFIIAPDCTSAVG